LIDLDLVPFLPSLGLAVRQPAAGSVGIRNRRKRCISPIALRHCRAAALSPAPSNTIARNATTAARVCACHAVSPMATTPGNPGTSATNRGPAPSRTTLLAITDASPFGAGAYDARRSAQRRPNREKGEIKFPFTAGPMALGRTNGVERQLKFNKTLRQCMII
jgi:hypothetical protein